MENRKTKLFLLTLILIFILLLSLIVVLLYVKYIREDTGINDYDNSFISDQEGLNTNDAIKQALLANNCELLLIDSNKFYVSFSKNLYEDTGESNEGYFEKLIKEVSRFYKNRSFYLIDEERNIEIYASWNEEDDNHDLKTIDGEYNFYEKTKGDSFIAVENVEKVKRTGIETKDYYMLFLTWDDFYFKNLKEKLGEPTKEEGGYKYYLDNALKLKLLPNKVVFNIVFNDLYDGENIVEGIYVKMPLNKKLECINNRADVVFGGLSDGYLGFIGKSYYYFFYDDEISIYPYSDNNEAKKFYSIVKDYVEEYRIYKSIIDDNSTTAEQRATATADIKSALDKLQLDLKLQFKCYDEFEYDQNIGRLRVRVAMYGFDVDIKDFDATGIKVYSNFTFNDDVKELCRKGEISIDSRRDLIEKVELERKNKD